MLMFSRNFPRVEGKGRDGAPLAETERAVVGREEEAREARDSKDSKDSSTSFFSRSTARASLKKSRPHSWHSTLQRGLQR